MEPSAAGEAFSVGSPRSVTVMEALPLPPLPVGMLFGNAAVMRQAVLNAVTLLHGRVDPGLAAMDQAIPTWVIQKAKGIAFMWICMARARARRECPVPWQHAGRELTTNKDGRPRGECAAPWP